MDEIGLAKEKQIRQSYEGDVDIRNEGDPRNIKNRVESDMEG